MTITWNTGIESGIISATGTGMWSALSGVPTVETSIKHTGTYAGRVRSVAAGAVNCRKNLSASAQIFVARAYVYFPSGGLPDATVNVFGTAVNTAGYTSGITVKSDGVWRGVIASGASVDGGSVTVDTWHRVDIRLDIRASTWTLDWSIDGVAQTQVTLSGQSTTDSLLYLRVGSASTTVNMDMYFDDVAISETLGDFPIAGDSTIALKPSSDGTHNAGTNIIEDNAGTDIGATTAWDKVDDIPINGASNYVRQAANGSGNYAEVSFENMSVGASAIQGATAFLAYTSETTTSNNGGCIVSKDDFSSSTEVYGTPATPLDMSDGNTGAPFYKSALIAGVNDVTTVNALKARFGYSSDANPDPYWLNIIVEVSYTASTSISGTLSKSQAGNTLSSSSKVQLKGTLSKAQSGDALSSVSDLIIKGATAKAQAGNTLSAAGKITLKGSVNTSQAGNTLSAAADLIGKGTLNKSQSNQTLDADGVLSLKGSLSKSQQSNTLDADGVVHLDGDLSKTQDDQTLSSSAKIALNGSLNVTQQGQTLDGEGSIIIPGGIVGSVSLAQADNEVIAFGDAHLKASVNVTQQDNAQDALGRLSLKGTVNVTQQGNTAVSSGSVTIAGILDVSQGDQLATISSKIALKALLNVSQAGNVLSSVIQYMPPIAGPGRVDVIMADDMDKIYAEDNGIIYADDINDI